MKNKSAKFMIGIVFTLVVIVISALFRSLLDKVTYFAAIDKVVSVLINELWKFFSTPTIFIAILIGYILLVFKDNIAAVFPAIKEIKAGQFSATIDYSSTSEKKTTPADSDVDVLVDSLGKKTCEFLLEIDQKELPQKELAQKIEDKKIFITDADTPDQNGLTGFAYGVARSLRSYLLPRLGTVEISDDKREMTFTLQPEVRNKIKARLAKSSKKNK